MIGDSRVSLAPRLYAGSPFSLMISRRSRQTLPMRKLTTTIYLMIIVLLGGAGCTQNLLGGDRDEHGCMGSAGYKWSPEKQQCVRPWEHK